LEAAKLMDELMTPAVPPVAPELQPTKPQLN